MTAQIIQLAFRLTDTVAALKERVRWFYYAVLLMGHSCPRCNAGLIMVHEGQCQCQACDYRFDPTAAFQRCSACGGQPVLRVRRYQCQHCGADIQSRFLFGGFAFDAAYFRERMAEHRRRKAEQRDRVRLMLSETRSEALSSEAADLAVIPGLAEALNSLTTTVWDAESWRPGEGFDLRRYQSHIQAHLRPFPLSLAEIPPLSEHARKDRIWRFIAILFLAHTGIVEIWQEGQDIMVRQRETDAERQDISGDLEATGRSQGSECPAQA